MLLHPHGALHPRCSNINALGPRRQANLLENGVETLARARAIIKKRLCVEASLYTILQILSLMLFEKTPMDQLLNDKALLKLNDENPIQLNLFS